MKHRFSHPTLTNHSLHCQTIISRLPQYNNQLRLTPCSSIIINEKLNDSYISTNDCKNNNITQQTTTEVSITTSLGNEQDYKYKNQIDPNLEQSLKWTNEKMKTIINIIVI